MGVSEENRSMLKGADMKRVIASVVLGSVLVVGGTTAMVGAQQTRQTERAAHPRISRAIHELEEAIKYMEAAPHDFGGHKAAAIQSSRQAIQDLRQALSYRARQDNRK
jgi:hypothetical protein